MPQVARITWGQNFSNILTFAYPVEGIRCWSAPRPGSSRSRTDSGVEDMWLSGKDYWMAGTFRWVTNRDQTVAPVMTGYDGPVGLRAMLDWAHRGNQVRFAPDVTYPNNYITCDVVAPWDDEATIEQDYTYGVPFRLRSTERPFSQAIAALMFEFDAGMAVEDFGATFSRSTTATYIGPDGLLKTAAIDELRHEWLDLDGDGVVETLGTLMEGPRTNIALQASDPNNATWLKSNCTIGVNATYAPDGSLSADKLQETNAVGVSHRITQNITITGGGTYAVSAWFKPAERTRAQIRFRDGADANRFLITLDTAGSGSVTTNVLGTGSVVTGSAFLRRYRNGWWRWGATGSLGGAITASCFDIFTVDATGNTVYTGTTGSGAFLWGVQCEAGSMSTSFIPTTTASVTRGGDVLYWANSSPIPVTDFTAYLKVARPPWADFAGTLSFTPVGLMLGDVGAGNARVELSCPAAARTINATMTDPTTASTGGSVAIPAGTTLEWCLSVQGLPDAAQGKADFGSGYGALGATITFTPAWTGAQLTLGGSGVVGSNAFHGHILSAKLAVGSGRTLAAMRAL